MAADDRAIVVGINHYPALGHLAGPENDAKAFYEWLKSKDGGAVPTENMCLILSSCFETSIDPIRAKPTTEALREAIDDLYQLGDSHGGRTGRRLYLYMAGHGFAPDVENTALLMANAARGRTGHHFQGRPYANWFRQSAFFDEVVLFMDCCRGNYPLSPLQGCHLDTLTARRNTRYYYGFAADFTRAAREPDGNGIVQGFFTTALLAGLRAGPPEGCDITGSWLEAFVHNYLPMLLSGRARQEPKFDYDHRGDIVFAKRESPVFHFRIHTILANQSRPVELMDGFLHPVTPLARSDGIWEWKLGPGLYKYGYSGGPYQICELIGEGRNVDVELI